MGESGNRRSTTLLSSGQRNGLNCLRLILAFAVIISHSPPIAGMGEDPHVGVVSIGGVAVAGFFAISGFLITQSRERTSGGRFAVRRLLRIMPGFWLCLVITAFVLAALVGQERGGWSAGAATDYVRLGFDMLAWVGTIGGTLDGLPIATDWNGSLWTLPFELLCYAGIGLALIPRMMRTYLRWWPLIGFAGLVLLSEWSAIQNPVVVGPLFLALFFCAGIIVYAWRDSLPVDPRLAVAALIVLLLALQSVYTVWLAAVPGAYLCIWFGLACPEAMKRIGRRNDISYGIYLYGWPVQQTLVAFGFAERGLLIYTACAIACAIPLAWFSWVAVERPATRLAARLTRSRKRSRTPDDDQAGRHRRLPSAA